VIFTTHELEPQLERGLEQAIHDELRQHVGDADYQPTRPALALRLGRVHQLATEREDLVRISVDGATELREHERAAFTLEQRATEQLFQAFDLLADGWLSEA
jgi:hypothetical protein